MTIEIAETVRRQSIPTAGPTWRECPADRLQRRRIADRLFRRAAARLPMRLVYPDGTVVGAADPTLPTMVIHRPEAMFARGSAATA